MTWEKRFSQIRHRINTRHNELKDLKKPPSPISSFDKQKEKIKDAKKSISSVEQRIKQEKECFSQTPITEVQTISTALPFTKCGEEWLKEKTCQVKKIQDQTIAMKCQEQKYVKGMEQQETEIKQEMRRMQNGWK